MKVAKKISMDQNEVAEWHKAFSSLIRYVGLEAGAQVLDALAQVLYANAYTKRIGVYSKYVNTLLPSHEPKFPDTFHLSERLGMLCRWNAAAMVVRAGRTYPELGGHISTYSSIAGLYSVGFDYFFKGNDDGQGDCVYFQGHSSPGIYARSFMEGRLSKDQLNHFRQEVGGKGLASYPHPWTMSDYWQFPTVSMGLGPLQAIYQARFMRYMQARGLLKNDQRKVWVFCGDGEMDEPESMSAISLAGRDQLSNLIYIVNCNLQRLDGPVRGNGKIIQELEAHFSACGWYVIKVVWNRHWDELFSKDRGGVLHQRLMDCVDGDFQQIAAEGIEALKRIIFNTPKLKQLIAGWNDERLTLLNRGGHDWQKVYAAYHAAVVHQHQPVVILAKTIKGYGLGSGVRAANTAHNQKKLSAEQMQQLSQELEVPLSHEQAAQADFYKPKENDDLYVFMKQQRKSLGGKLPYRSHKVKSLPVPDLEFFKSLLVGSEREMSTTMAFVRVLGLLLRDPELKQYIVPISPDESRTFGMEGLFRQLGIYSPSGQQYQPVDHNQVMPYKESSTGQFLQEGINEAGAMASWIAAATAYSVHQAPMIPFYIYYSMFGFQRIGDLAWAAADSRARGFLLGATAGRTTLAGEGLQHTDGHSHVMAATIPNCVSYDPTFAYELAVIIRHGLKVMYKEQQDVFYYITVMNENYTQMPMPEGSEEGIIKGLYPIKPSPERSVNLVGSGAILRECLQAEKILQKYGVASSVWSITSMNTVVREQQALDRLRYLKPEESHSPSHLEKCLGGEAPVVVATDYIRHYAEGLRAGIKAPLTLLGTDGFGRSDTRMRLRQHFEVNAESIAYAALYHSFKINLITQETLIEARQSLGINGQKPNPMEV
jgi:pyruvate dehydrogenase E1 component